MMNCVHFILKQKLKRRSACCVAQASNLEADCTNGKEE